MLVRHAVCNEVTAVGGRYRLADGSSVALRLNTVEAYNPQTDTWATMAAMPTARRSMAVGTLNGRAQVAGGERKGDGSTFPQNASHRRYVRFGGPRFPPGTQANLGTALVGEALLQQTCIDKYADAGLACSAQLRRPTAVDR